LLLVPRTTSADSLQQGVDALRAVGRQRSFESDFRKAKEVETMSHLTLYV
jgi:hypothetical protein